MVKLTRPKSNTLAMIKAGAELAAEIAVMQ
jgi:hypothetical protein